MAKADFGALLLSKIIWFLPGADDVPFLARPLPSLVFRARLSIHPVRSAESRVDAGAESLVLLPLHCFGSGLFLPLPNSPYSVERLAARASTNL